MNYKLPGKTKNHKGEIRKAGFELEFSDVGIERAAEIIVELFNGKIEEINKFSSTVDNTSFGKFGIEVDTAILKDKKYEKFLEDAGIVIEDEKLREDLEEVINDLATVFVPYEVVTPPIPFDKLELVDRLSVKLRDAGAKGTTSSIIHAFGLHINIETPSTDVETLLNFLRAYFLLHDWIVSKSEINFARRITPYIGDFPYSYIQKITDCNYSPDMEELIDDYIKENATRNRSLDMLPLFAFIYEDVNRREITGKELISPRPAFHYRLPNCMIDEPTWNPSDEWNRWIFVENLADNHDKVTDMCKEFQLVYNSFNGKSKWIDIVEDRLLK